MFAKYVVFRGAPERFMEAVKEFTNEHFPGKSVFTAVIPGNTSLAQELAASKKQPLSVTFKNVCIDAKLANDLPVRGPGI